MNQAKLSAAFAGCSIYELLQQAAIHRFAFSWLVASVALICLSVSLSRSRI